jgi:hypothetical protein
VTIFGPSFEALRPEDVRDYLDQADDEPLLWEAKGTELDKYEVRRQVCAFANGHETGYLILGAEPATSDNPPHKWVVNGVEFPGGEPRPWITDVIGDPERGVRPRPDFDVQVWEAANGHVAVVRVRPTSTPPCLANGTVYERLPGKSQTVRDPLILAGLYSRGDQARRAAEASADNAAEAVVNRALAGDAGMFRAERMAAQADREVVTDDATGIRFAVGVSATGNPPNISGRLFQAEFARHGWDRLRDRPLGLPPGLYGPPPDPVAWSQEALTWRHETIGPVSAITMVRAAWDGSVAAGQKLAMGDFYADTFAPGSIADQWRLADELVQRLGGYGDVYMTVLIAPARFRRRQEVGPIVMRRGPILPGVAEEYVDSLGRELKRALGYDSPEP